MLNDRSPAVSGAIAGLCTSLLLLAACGRPATQPITSEADWSDIEAKSPLVGYRATFVLTWRGARMGSAHEELRQRDAGLRFTRREHIVVRRGEVDVLNETTIVVDTDQRLRASAVTVRRSSGASVIEGIAGRRPDGRWSVRFGDEPERTVDADTVPSEIVPLLVAARADRRFDGRVFLPGSGFALAHLSVAPTRADRALVTAHIETAHGPMSSVVGLLGDGTVRSFEGDDGVGARRVDPASAEAPFDPPELVDDASIPVEGRANEQRRVALIVHDVHHSRPPDLPGQRMVIEGEDLWHLVLGPSDAAPVELPARTRTAVASDIAALADAMVTGATNRFAEVVALTQGTARLIEGDLSASAIDPHAALALGRGDCTSHTMLFVALANARGIDARVVTGYRIDGARMVRHRWAIADVDGTWIAVDPTYGEAPAAPRLLGLAVHGESAADLAIVDSLAFSGMNNAHARILPWHE